MNVLFFWMFLFYHLQEGDQCSIAESSSWHSFTRETDATKKTSFGSSWNLIAHVHCTMYNILVKPIYPFQPFCHYLLFDRWQETRRHILELGPRDWSLVWLTKKNNVTIDILVLPAFRKYWVFKAFCLHVDSGCHEPNDISAHIH